MAAQKTIATLRARVTELEDEVARLKKDLAAANAKTLATPPAKTAREIVVKARGKDTGETVSSHPPGQCYKTACWCKAS